MFKFLTEHWVDAFLVFMILISLLTGNKTLLYAMGIVFVLRMVRATAVLEILAGKGISWGILVITIGFLAPIALERYDPCSPAPWGGSPFCAALPWPLWAARA